MVSVTTSWSILDSRSRATAGPDSTACVAHAITNGAPAACTASAAVHSVPAVSTMSSTMTAARASTSPMICISPTTLARMRRLSMMARCASSRFANARARSTPPASGAMTVTSPLPSRFAQVLQEHGGGVDVVDGHVEETLDLSRVQVDREHARRAGGRDQVGDQLGADGNPRRHLPVLPGIAVVRDDRGDALGRRALERVEHQEELHQVVVGRGADGLDHEHVAATDVLRDLDLDLAVAEPADLGASQRHADVSADRLGQAAIGVPRE